MTGTKLKLNCDNYTTTITPPTESTFIPTQHNMHQIKQTLLLNDFLYNYYSYSIIIMKILMPINTDIMTLILFVVAFDPSILQLLLFSFICGFGRIIRVSFIGTTCMPHISLVSWALSSPRYYNIFRKKENVVKGYKR